MKKMIEVERRDWNWKLTRVLVKIDQIASDQTNPGLQIPTSGIEDESTGHGCFTIDVS